MNMKKSLIISTLCATLLLVACKENKKNAVDTQYDKNSQFSTAEFKNPSAQYRIVPFWSWNETMEPDEIRRQLRLMKKAGWGGSMIHSRTGLLTEYLGEDWFKAVDATLDESRKLGMLVWLYDEDKWPSGYSGGTVLHEDPNFAVKCLYAIKAGEKAIDGAVKVGDAVDGIQVYSYTSPMGNPWFNGTSYVDTMSRKAMEVFKREAYDSYYKRYKNDFGNLIVAEFTDEPALASHYGKCPASNIVYSSDLIDAFKKEYGFDPVPHFHKLFVDCDGAKKFRLQYFRVANKLFENNFMKLLGDACAERNISLTGHCMAEAPVFSQHLWSGRIMPYYRHMGIPGIDHLARCIATPLTGKQCQSVCNQYGKTRMLSELYGVSGGSLTFEDRQWITHHQFVVGVNVLVPHLSLFSQTGCRKRDYPQNINYQQSWWELNSKIDVPLARACYALSQGKYATDILLLHPQESAASLWKRDVSSNAGGTPTEAKKNIAIQTAFVNAGDVLLGSQLTFDLGDEQLLEEDGFVKGNEIGIKQSTYKVVLVPDADTMRPATMKRLKEFVANGGLVLRLGKGAKLLDGEPSAELDAFMKSLKQIDIKDVRAELEKKIPAMITVEKKSGDQSKVWTHIRNYNDGSRLIMLTNLSRAEKYNGLLKIAGSYTRAQLLDMESGELKDIYAERKNNSLELPLNLECAQAIYLRVSNEAPVAKVPVEEKVLRTQTLADWKAERLDDNSMTLDYASFSYNGGKKFVNGEVPTLEIWEYFRKLKYDGDVTVKYYYKAKDFDKNRKLHLVVEYPEKAVIKVNGKEVKYAGLPFWKDFRWLPIDITGMTKDGTNEIELHYKDFKYSDPTVHQPQWRRYGTEIEAVYLVGDFSVVSKDTGRKVKNEDAERYQAKPTKANYISKADLAITNPTPLKYGNQTINGLPFYAGRLAYSKKIDFGKLNAGERVIIKLGDLDAPVAQVFVDGKDAGVIKNEPFELDITKFVKSETAEVKVVLYATLRNIMDALHNVRGEIYSIWPPMFFIEDLPRPNPEKQLETLQAFADGKWQSKRWIKDYCQVSFGDTEGIELVIKK
ncbi:MAG: hypothetical protein E7036_01315 [Opitutales bacterium]|nr:hypothetical protein [Opitutales bacterium]